MKYEKNSIVFTDWKIVREIGEGSYGKVFEICKTDYGITTRSALKVIRIPHSISDIRTALNEGMDEQSVTTYFQGFVDEIVQEIAIMSSLKSHPNIVSYEDHCVLNHNGEIGWDILIRMELLTPLEAYLGNHKLSENDIIHMGENLCDALSFCQKKGMIHRDIKPENIFISETGQFKLGDFGVARTVEKTTGGLSKKGTESYMAPEVYLNQPYGSGVDIYSLGLVLYRFMNNNRLPFLPPLPQPITFADRENALSRRMKGEALPAPVNASKEFADIILKACAYKPEERYRTAADMLEDIHNLKPGSSQTAALMPNIAEVSSSSEETKGIFDAASSEETIGLWNISTPQKEASNEPPDSACKESAPSEENAVIESYENDTLSEELPADSEPSNGSEPSNDLESTDDSEPSDDSESPVDLPQPKKSTAKKKWLIGVAAVLIIGGGIGGLKLYEHMKAIRHEQVQESIEVRESLFEAAEAVSNYYEAIRQYKSAIETYPYDERGYIQLANLKIEKKEFQGAYDILQKGIEFCPDSDEIKQLSEQAKALVNYAQKVKEGDNLNAAANYEEAIKKYQEALQIDSTQEDAYAGIVQCYLIQNKIKEAQDFLQNDSAKNLPEKSMKRLRSACHMQHIYNLLSQEDYMAIREDLKNNKEDFFHGFYQNGKYNTQYKNFDLSQPVLKIYANNTYTSVYYGTLNSYGQYQGNGKEFHFLFENGSYYHAEGEWQGFTLSSGNAFSQKYITSSDGSDFFIIYSGGIKNDMFYGDINISQTSLDGSQYSNSIQRMNGLEGVSFKIY